MTFKESHAVAARPLDTHLRAGLAQFAPGLAHADAGRVWDI